MVIQYQTDARGQPRTILADCFGKLRAKKPAKLREPDGLAFLICLGVAYRPVTFRKYP